ncbi:hypothetical protein [Sediminibacillus albus]|uniref:Uncharacterized protein n=1 Tax=Sediminibacillus albus TaxID=407036 RepID=A0A1G8VTD4_9BACI|nr:hypothetical protein [Sediminibacillus albus]SDJ69302.1 hypothetical protein SAMN05216243_0342 [Sediminibacillus albus]
MLLVRMNVQTAYHGEIFREGKEYEVDDSTANRWQSSKIATIVIDSEQKEIEDKEN